MVQILLHFLKCQMLNKEFVFNLAIEIVATFLALLLVSVVVILF